MTASRAHRTAASSPAGTPCPTPSAGARRGGEQTDAEDTARTVGGGRQRGAGRQQRQPDQTRPAGHVDEHDDGDDQHRQARGQLPGGTPAGTGPPGGGPVPEQPPRRVVATMVSGLAHVASAVLAGRGVHTRSVRFIKQTGRGAGRHKARDFR